MTTLQNRILKAMRLKEGCDIPTLAAACRIKTPSVHGWINGGTKSLAAGPAIRAAAYLGVNALWLAEGEGPMVPSTPVGGGQRPAQPVTEPYHHKPRRKLLAHICDIAENINDIGLKRLIPMAEDAAKMYPLHRMRRQKAKAA